MENPLWLLDTLKEIGIYILIMKTKPFNIYYEIRGIELSIA